MLEKQSSLLPTSASGEKLRVLLIGFDQPSLSELEQLVATLEYEVAAESCISLRSINPATYIGAGKVSELQEAVETQKVNAIVVDAELSPNQLKNLEKALGKPTIDRPGVIIEIFSQHARTKEAKTQVELARLEYLLPRLTHFWSHFERQRGGIGQKGMGEKQLEVDRRLLKRRMSILQGRLKDIEKERKVQRTGRRDVLKVALVGYTNAGKSTLLNAMTHSQVRAEDKLFATLDASVRALDPDSHPPVVAIDTVGFISKIPPSLVASFRSTLEELFQADLLLHIVDASSPHAREQFEVTEKVLAELGVADTPRLTVLNKTDRLVASRKANLARIVAPGALRISALSKKDVERLRDRVLDHFRKELEVWELVVPYSESKLESQLHAYGSIEKTRYLEKGTFYRLRIGSEWAKKLKLSRFQT